MDPLTIFHKRIQQYDSFFPELRKYLSKNPNITLDMVLQDIQRNPSKQHQWEFNELAKHIPVKDLLPFTVLDLYNFDPISLYGNIDIDTLLKNPSVPWDWCRVTMNSHITMEDIADHPELPWDYDVIFQNPNLKFHLIALKHERPETFYKLSKIATLEQLEQYPNKPWSSACLSSPYIRDKIKLKELQELFHKTATLHDQDLTFYFLAHNPNLNFQDLQDLLGSHIKFFFYASLNPSITVQDFLSYPNEQWGFESLSITLPVDFMLEHPEYNWYWNNVLYFNKTLTYKKLTERFYTIVQDYYINKYKEGIKFYDTDTNTMYFPGEADQTIFYIKYYLIQVNKHVSWHDKKCIFEELLPLTSHPHFVRLACIPLFLEPTFQEIRHHFAKKQIVRHIVECLTNPAYEQCRKRLKREHEKMNDSINTY